MGYRNRDGVQKQGGRDDFAEADVKVGSTMGAETGCMVCGRADTRVHGILGVEAGVLGILLGSRD